MEASVTIVVGMRPAGKYDFSMLATQRPYTAFVVSNPQIRADGATEAEAVKRLRQVINSNIGMLDWKTVKAPALPTQSQNR
jgi:transcriptional regulator of NAD metabolism